MVSVIREGVCCVWIHEKKTNRVRKSEICSPTRFARLNRREPQSFALLSASGLRPSLESALRARRIGFADPHSRKSLARQSLARKHSVCSAKIAGCAVDPPQLRLSAFSVQPARKKGGAIRQRVYAEASPPPPQYTRSQTFSLLKLWSSTSCPTHGRKPLVWSQVYRLARLRDLKVPASAEVGRFQRPTRQRNSQKGGQGRKDEGIGWL